jgi:hypothetical protein
MRRIFIITIMFLVAQAEAQDYKSILYTDSGKTAAKEKVTCDELKNMTLFLKVPVIDSVEDYWSLIVEIYSDYTCFYFKAELDSEYIKKNCIGKEFIYLKMVSPDYSSDFHCSNNCNDGEPLNYYLLCDKTYKCFWASDKDKYQNLTATVIYLGKWVTNYNGSDIYERKEIENEILKIKRP